MTREITSCTRVLVWNRSSDSSTRDGWNKVEADLEVMNPIPSKSDPVTILILPSSPTKEGYELSIRYDGLVLIGIAREACVICGVENRGFDTTMRCVAIRGTSDSQSLCNYGSISLYDCCIEGRGGIHNEGTMRLMGCEVAGGVKNTGHLTVSTSRIDGGTGGGTGIENLGRLSSFDSCIRGGDGDTSMIVGERGGNGGSGITTRPWATTEVTRCTIDGGNGGDGGTGSNGVDGGGGGEGGSGIVCLATDDGTGEEPRLIIVQSSINTSKGKGGRGGDGIDGSDGGSGGRGGAGIQHEGIALELYHSIVGSYGGGGCGGGRGGKGGDAKYKGSVMVDGGRGGSGGDGGDSIIARGKVRLLGSYLCGGSGGSGGEGGSHQGNVPRVGGRGGRGGRGGAAITNYLDVQGSTSSIQGGRGGDGGNGGQVPDNIILADVMIRSNIPGRGGCGGDSGNGVYNLGNLELTSTAVSGSCGGNGGHGTDYRKSPLRMGARGGRGGATSSLLCNDGLTSSSRILSCRIGPMSPNSSRGRGSEEKKVISKNNKGEPAVYSTNSSRNIFMYCSIDS
jgi:hypothetical protein